MKKTEMNRLIINILGRDWFKFLDRLGKTLHPIADLCNHPSLKLVCRKVVCTSRKTSKCRAIALIAFVVLFHSLAAQPTFIPARLVDTASVRYTSLNLQESSKTGEYTVHYSLKDQEGNFITGAGESDQKERMFANFKGCKDWTVREIKEGQPDRKDFSFAIVMDYSGSMSGYEAIVHEQTMKFVQRIRNEDAIASLRFDDSTTVIAPLTRHKIEVVKALREMDRSADKGTGMLTALEEAILLLSQSPRSDNRIIFVLTDGGETNRNREYLDTLASLCNYHAVSIFPISIGNGDNQDYLRKVATKCGGRAAREVPPTSVDSLLTEIYDKLQNHYEIRCVDPGRELLLPNGGDEFRGQAKVDPWITLKASDGLVRDSKFDAGNIPPRLISPTFRCGDAAISKDAQKQLCAQFDLLIPYLKGNPDATFYIYGYASPDGEEKNNIRISYKRAKIVEDIAVEYFIENLGFAPNIESKFFGESKATCKENASKEVLERERKVDFGILPATR